MVEIVEMTIVPGGQAYAMIGPTNRKSTGYSASELVA